MRSPLVRIKWTRGRTAIDPIGWIVHSGELLLWNLVTPWHSERRKQKQEEGYADTLGRVSLDRSCFSCETCGLYFYRDNSLDYLIQSEYIYKTREVLVYIIPFFSSSKRKRRSTFVLLLCLFFFSLSLSLSLSHARALYLSFSLPFSHSFIRCLSSTRASIHLLFFLSLFLLLLARATKPETRREPYARHAFASTNRSWAPTLAIRDEIRRCNYYYLCYT